MTDTFSFANTWVACKLTRDENANHKWYVGGMLSDSRNADTTYTTGYLALNHHTSGTGAVANLRLRKFIATEPSHGTWDGEDAVTPTDAGSGGSVYVICSTLTGSGTISARGGNATDKGGGGGRIAIDAAESEFNGRISAAGGTGAGGVGQGGSITWVNQGTRRRVRIINPWSR